MIKINFRCNIAIKDILSNMSSVSVNKFIINVRSIHAVSHKMWWCPKSARNQIYGMKHCLPFVMMRRIRPWNSAKNLHRDDGYKSIVRMCCVCVLLISDWNASSWLNTHVTGHVMRDPHKSNAVKRDCHVTMELSNEIQSESKELVTSRQIPLPVQ